MDYMPLLLRQFLGGSAPDLPPNEFKAYILALAHIYEDEGPVSDRTMIRHLTSRGWQTVRPRLIEKGRLVEVEGGYMDRIAHALIADYHAEQERSSQFGRKGGLVSAAKRREAERKRAASRDLFSNEMDREHSSKKGNENSEGAQPPLKHTRAHAHEESASIGDASAIHPRPIGDASRMLSTHSGKNANDFNGSLQPPLKERELEVEEEKTLQQQHRNKPPARVREDFAAQWNERAKACGWPLILKIDDKRWKSLKARLDDHGEGSFAELLKRAGRSDLLHPMSGKPPHWFDFDFIISPKGYLKTLEGRYDELRQSDRDPTTAALERYIGSVGP